MGGGPKTWGCIMNFISFACECSSSTEWSLAAVKRYGNRVGKPSDHLELFYASTKKEAKKDSDIPQFAVMYRKNNDELLSEFGAWVKRNDDAIIIATTPDLAILFDLERRGVEVMKRTVNIDSVFCMIYLEEYARRHGIDPCYAEMNGPGGELVWKADRQAQCYRFLLWALNLHDLPVYVFKRKLMDQIAVLGSETLAV